MYGIKFLTDTIFPEIKRLQSSGFYLPSNIMMMQAIEYLGSVIDKKPLKAREQSKKRFSIAIKKLFDTKYQYFNKNNELYDHLRNHLLHTFTSGSVFEIIPAAKSKGINHFSKTESGKIVIIAEVLLSDIEKAAEKCLKNY